MNIDDQSLQLRVENMVEKYLTSRRIIAPLNAQGYVDFDMLEKHFQKNQLMTSIINNISEIVQQEMEDFTDQINEQIAQLENQLSQVKEMVLKSLSSSRPFASPQKPSAALNSSVLSMDSQSTKGDKNQKSIMKRIEEVEEGLKRRIQHTDNLLNILMDNSVVMKATISELERQQKGESPYLVNSNIIQNDESIQNILNQLDEKVEKKTIELKKNVEITSNQQKDYMKDKIMFYWTVLNDLSDKHEKLRKEFDELKGKQAPQNKSLLKRGSIFGGFVQ